MISPTRARGSRHERAAWASSDALPTSVAASVIDLARENSAVIRAGAVTVPMSARKVTVPRLTSDLAVSWEPELAVQEEASPAFDGVVLNAHTVRAWTVLSEEWLEDVDPEVSDGFVAAAAARAIAAEMDRVSLIGSGVGEEPRGIANVVGIPTAGATGPPSWADLLNGWAVVRGANYAPTAALHNPPVEAALGLLVGTDGQYLRPPATIQDLPRLVTNVLAASGETPIVLGDFSRLLVGVRSEVNVRLGEQFAASRNGVVLKVSARMDVAVERSAAFAIRRVTLQ